MGSNINSFLAETNKEIAKLQKKQVSEAKKIVLGAYNQVLERSPVDTGLFKHNNFLTVNSKTNRTTEEPHQEVIDGGKENIDKAKFKNNDTITIQNHLAYADALEAGVPTGSSQAPAGVYGVTERLVQRVLSKRTKI